MQRGRASELPVRTVAARVLRLQGSEPVAASAAWPQPAPQVAVAEAADEDSVQAAAVEVGPGLRV